MRPVLWILSTGCALLLAMTQENPPESSSASDPEEPFFAKVIGVTDGDTLTVLRKDKSQVRIRLAAIDAPELGQEFGRAAKTHLSELAFGKSAHVYPEGVDRYGRMLARVVAGNRDLNRSMLSNGYAWHYRKYSDSKSLQSAEDRARRKKRGLWAPGNAMAPWEFRKTVPKEKLAKAAAEESAPAPVTVTEDPEDESEPEAKPTLTHWITNSSGVRHNSSCRWFKRSRGRLGSATTGRACKICGG